MLEFLCLPQCWFHEVEILGMYSHIPLGLNQLLNVGVNQWFQISVVDTCQWVYLSVEGLNVVLLVGPLSFPSLPPQRLGNESRAVSAPIWFPAGMSGWCSVTRISKSPCYILAPNIPLHDSSRHYALVCLVVRLFLWFRSSVGFMIGWVLLGPFLLNTF